MATAAATLADYSLGLARSAKEAARALRGVPGAVKDRALRRAAEQLRGEMGAILAANALDRAAAPSFGLSVAQVDRLTLNERRVREMADAVELIAACPDPIGEVISSTVRPNGLEVLKTRVPLGVVLFLYESRPNVTSDAAALCLKSGNAVILRGGKEARHSNQAIVNVLRGALEQESIPAGMIGFVETTDRAVVGELLRLDRYIDIAIPRGGEDLIRRVVAEATMPVLKHYKGVCHVYIDESADAQMASAIVENAKCQRPAVCNAAETLLIHEAIAGTLLPGLAKRLIARGVELRGCERARALVPAMTAATAADFGAEFGELILAVRVVRDLDEAAEHIERHGSGHTETIVTESYSAARRFTTMVDSAAVMVNASTRFNDGGEFGLGAEIGISTDKFHARGPCGVNELTSYKYVVFGSGQVRG